MRLIFFLIPISFVCAELLPCPDPKPLSEMIVDLRNPTYKNGILYTHEGGVIRNEDIRIQARTIQYIRKDGEHKIEAEGDLLIQYKGKVYVGTELEYDFITKTGTVYEGKTFSSIWYVGGDKIELNADGSYHVVNAFITTCENADSTWDVHAGKVNLAKGDLVQAEKVRFRLFKIPAMWFPSFKANLKKFKEPIFRYSLNWDKGQGPRATVRYRFYSWKDFAMYGRIEYRWKTGWGGAFETEYLPTDYPTTFVTRSYVGTDRLETAPDKMRRYRLQGAFNSTMHAGKTCATLTWDKYSDVRMPADFKYDDFEVQSAKRTLLYVRHQQPNYITSLKVRPKVNNFESIKQDLPSLYFTARPLEIGRTGIYSTNVIKASYLDFSYSDHLTQNISGYDSLRFELREKLYRPFHLGPVTLTPNAGLIAIFYGNSPSSHPKPLALGTYGARLDARAIRPYAHYKHQVEPYLEFTGLTAPTVSPNNHYIFTIQDGYNKINQLQAGIRNLLFSRKHKINGPSFTADLYANAFFAEFAIPQLIPRLYLDLSWNIASLNFTTRNCYNFQNQVLDYTNTRIQYTINENAAFAIEGRYRSQYDWRKADHENFILDVTQPQSNLLLSPLSDRRVTLLAHIFFRPTPFWECHIQSHHGFARAGEWPYNEVKVDLYKWISSALKLRISYSHTDLDDRVTAGISLVRK